MKTAPDEVRNLVISEKNDTVNEDDINANIDGDDSHSDTNSIVADNEFIYCWRCCFECWAHGKRGHTIF